MKVVSYTDLQMIPELSKFNMFDFMHPNNDDVVNKYLYTMGFDFERSGLEYRVCQHRNLKGEKVIGLQIAGEIRIDREFLSSEWCTAEDRMIACGLYDRSLGDDLSKAMNVQVQYGSVHALDDEESMKEHWQQQEEIERIEDELATLGIVLDSIRGDQRKRDGSLKRPRDYHEVEPYERVRRKKKNRSTLKHREIS